LRAYWQDLDAEDRAALQPMLNNLKEIAAKADAKEPVA
jgi:hypothetical protein